VTDLMAGRVILYCLHVSLCFSQGMLIYRDQAKELPRLRQLLMLRGGAPPASVVEKPSTPSLSESANASQPLRPSRPPAARRARPRTTFGVRDAVAATLVLSAAGAAQWCSNTNMIAAMMRAAVPAHVRKPVWVLISGALAATLFLLVRITNPPRAIAINRVLSSLVLNRESTSSLPSLALVTILGCVAAIKALPAYDLQLLWAMFTSLALLVGAAALKFDGKRPSLSELLEWAWDSITASLSSSGSGPSSPMR
jgi:hypothetical protein